MAMNLPPAFSPDWEPTIREIIEKLKPFVKEWNAGNGGYDECYCEFCFSRSLSFSEELSDKMELLISLGGIATRLLMSLIDEEDWSDGGE